MTQEDCLAIYQALVEMLNSIKLGWVTEQVADVISAGKTTEELVSGRKSPNLKLNYYSPQEQLLLLINAIEKSVINTGEIETEILDIFRHETQNSDLKPELRFTSSVDRKGTMFKYSIESVNSRQQHRQELKKLLEQLRQEIGTNVD
ncbi:MULTISPECIES: hypothetical protein [Planktothrix]|uniref:Uncharacterized protein n=1 Tax=Planktothrix rubescens CCAP 1459/22 TaxID=329571 RepID=A0A6J7ZTI8_PLARU|nr:MULTISPECIES: hypothetical protein [Planktothrix]CAC5345680.1 conserved hypothetical protein [Planktothrix rubescens NIVA-CYA 18]CAD0230126.1 conserved hypothetical protein [Planktothrix agardhii]CAD5946640.1 hypothetical protein PCC7811_02276 [Planktothrix agardhii]CAD5955259.1 hypothetical protein PCC7821_02799 [Planktothrix rubescens NIVA-CYA 18]CAD5956559.1 hypothetical protein NO758_02870 [Planktothrix agardhii]